MAAIYRFFDDYTNAFIAKRSAAIKHSIANTFWASALEILWLISLLVANIDKVKLAANGMAIFQLIVLL